MRAAIFAGVLALLPAQAAGGMLEQLFPFPDSCWQQVRDPDAPGPHSGIVEITLSRDGDIDREYGQMPLVPRLRLARRAPIAGWALCTAQADHVACHLELDGGSLILRADGQGTLLVTPGPLGALVDTGDGTAFGLAPDPVAEHPFRLRRADPAVCR